MEPIPPPPSAAPPDRRKSFARRALIQAGWAMPAALVLGLPRAAGAASAHNDSSHTDGPPFTDTIGAHTDTTHGDIHSDAAAVAHSDFIPYHLDDNPPIHQDISHGDGVPGHVDTGHLDGASPISHGDV